MTKRNNRVLVSNRNYSMSKTKWILLLLPFVAMACYEGLEGDVLNDADGQQPADAIEISPFDQTLDMAELQGWGAGSVISVSVASTEADFLMAVDSCSLYVEQNDDGQWRTAIVAVTRADGSLAQVTLAQPPASRASDTDARRSFYRHHAIGYSYDAIGGEYCNPNYVRCQLLNRAVIDELEKKYVEKFIFVERLNELQRTHSVYTSVVDYVQNSNFKADVEGGVAILFEGSIQTDIHAFEEGLIESYILRDRRALPRARFTLVPENIAKYVKSHPSLLTSSFRNALKRLAATPVSDWRAVDDFLDVYGSHMVWDVELGASLTLDVQVETHKFVDEINEGALSSVAIASLFEQHNSSSSETKEYQVLRDCKCVVDLVGGDMTILDAIMGMTTFSSENINISEDDLDRWERSVYFSDDDLANSNVEMTSMQVMPIWELIADETLAERIQSRVYSNAATMQRLLGNRNFVNVAIPYSQRKYVCRIGNQKYTFNDPDVTDIVVAGRYVATICHEPIPPIAGREKVYVVYPIYEGHVKLGSGLCVYKGMAYQVVWSHNELTVSKLGEVDEEYFDGNIYMNIGSLSTKRLVVADYLEGHPVAGVERPGGIAIDGSLAGQPVRVVKHFGHFYLNNKNRYDNLPNWSFVNKQPDEAKNYPEYFDATTWKDRMVRNDDYVYILNTTEIGYE